MTKITSGTKVDRRTVLAALGSAGAGLVALASPPVSGWGTDDDTLKAILPNFTEKSRKMLSAVTNVHGYSGEIPAARARELMDLEGKSSNELMLGLLPLARTYARPPISNFLSVAWRRASAVTCISELTWSSPTSLWATQFTQNRLR